MKNMTFILGKALKRIYRIGMYRGRIFGEIGKKNKFGWSCYINEQASIGNYNYIGPYVMLNNVSIKNFCSIGPGVKVGQGQHSIDYITTYNDISKNNINYKLSNQKTLIENDVWIGANAVVMQGIKVGNGAVIGANAVVTKDVPDYAIVVGVPARIIKYRFNEEIVNKLNDSRWWDLEKSKAVLKVKELEGIINENITY